MEGFLPFSNKDFDISFFVFRPTIVLVNDLVDAIKKLALSAENFGCVQSSIFKSIHGSMIIWYGAWMKRSCEDRESLVTSLLPMLTNILSMAVLIEHSFFDAYAGESKDGSPLAKFSIGDTISMNVAVSSPSHVDDLSYACLALFKSHFVKMEGSTAGVCLRCQNIPRVACLYVWKSLQHCYSWILNSDYRKTMLPYLHRFTHDAKYDVFHVVHVNRSNEVLNCSCLLPRQVLGVEGHGKEEEKVMQG